MNIYSLTCTRDSTPTATTAALLEYFHGCNIKTKLLINESSIFSAYSKGLDTLNANMEDIVILCHDDIQILSDSKVFTEMLIDKLSNQETGFIGVAGTRRFAKSAVWWDMEEWKAGSHSGVVFHGDNITDMTATLFGQMGEVVVMDGVFLAATVKTLRSIQLTKPRTFQGDWDFYDIFYTFQTYLNGLKNYTLPIQIRHESVGNLSGRDSWHNNRNSIIKIFGKHLPADIKKAN